MVAAECAYRERCRCRNCYVVNGTCHSECLTLLSLKMAIQMVADTVE
jgi:hypothetical protein